MTSARHTRRGRMLSRVLRWFGLNLLLLLGLVALWLFVAGLVLSSGDVAKIAAELPWATLLYFGSLLIPAVIFLTALAWLSARLTPRPLRMVAVLMSPLILLAFVPTTLATSGIDDPLLYVSAGLTLSLAFGLLVRLPPPDLVSSTNA